MNKLNFRVLIYSLCILACLQEACKSKKGSSGESQTSDHDIFSDNVRITDFQTPEEERKGFKLPPGFEITLFASEPDIGKPINMAFDAQGRLWVTNTTEYPYPAAPGKGHDKITILEDSDGDGKADKFTTFADNLNIPIGITPFRDGAIAYSIPDIYRFKDTDGDGKSDNRKILLGPFGFTDTHGMQNNFTRGFDGWIYACHGFTNTSTVAGTDGDSITMISGNTYRFLPDGSRVEQTTYGRVNPFGYAFDDWGYLYSLDCHSKPIYQLIRGAEYPQFGKKAPAIGFAPEMMSYEFGSTANSGLVYYTGLQFPEEYRHNFYSGNVVTSRINRNIMTLHGSSPKSKREPDFLVSSDPWFRPVDIKTGPDGSLYIADFYNRIIGHYEVPLDHPGRDHRSGRIWKITYTGNKPHQDIAPKNWSKLPLDELIKALNYPQLDIRMNIANQIVDAYGDKAVHPVMQMMQSENPDHKSFIQGLWILYRLKSLPDNLLDKALTHADPMIRVHGLRVLTEMKSISSKQYDQALIALNDKNPQVQRIAAEVLGRFPKPGNMTPLMNMYTGTSDEDMHLKYTILLSIREHLKNTAVMQDVAHRKWDDTQLGILMKVMPDVPSKEAASFALDYLQTHQVSQEQLIAYLGYIGRYIPDDHFDQAITLIRKKVSDDLDAQFALYQTIRQGVAQRGSPANPRLRQWGIDLARKVLEHAAEGSDTWSSRSLTETGDPVNPWSVINRPIVREIPKFKLVWSEFKGYPPLSSLHSPVFKLPSALQMKVFDNDIQNSESKVGTSKNAIRIRLRGSDKIIGEYRARFVRKTSNKELVNIAKFDLSGYQGQAGYIEVMDSTATGSVGIGEISPAVLNIPDKGPAETAVRQVQAAEIAADYHAVSLEPGLRKLLANAGADDQARTTAASTLMSLAPQQNTATLERVFNRQAESPAIRGKIAMALGQSSAPAVLAILGKGLAGAPRGLQVIIASVLSNSGAGIGYLLKAVKAGNINGDILSEIAVKERLAANIRKEQQQQLDQLLKGQALPEDRRKLIQERLASFDSSAVTAENGKTVFIRNCSMCHQINGQGGVVGPQLDGIGNWGQKALTEKILNPNGNISQAFRTYNITLKNGQVLTGLYRREEGNLLIFANAGGQEFSVAQSDIKERRASRYTLMPDQFSKIIAKKDFDALIKFLLTAKE
ncbi:PVC-type heme-binding CxxCH protein [Compostibacter hankyongensis]|uniref:Cytochrome c domain-containing protein n=1 Tax=Compostibacter hankyongensis TaxID=1007089 RepID=A0ABP8FJK6_9BACT